MNGPSNVVPGPGTKPKARPEALRPCGTCAFALFPKATGEAIGAVRQGACYLNPPTVTAIPTLIPPKVAGGPGTMQITFVSGRAQVTSEEGCTQHALPEEWEEAHDDGMEPE